MQNSRLYKTENVVQTIRTVHYTTVSTGSQHKCLIMNTSIIQHLYLKTQKRETVKRGPTMIFLLFLTR